MGDEREEMQHVVLFLMLMSLFLVNNQQQAGGYNKPYAEYEDDTIPYGSLTTDMGYGDELPTDSASG